MKPGAGVGGGGAGWVGAGGQPRGPQWWEVPGCGGWRVLQGDFTHWFGEFCVLVAACPFLLSPDRPIARHSLKDLLHAPGSREPSLSSGFTVIHAVEGPEASPGCGACGHVGWRLLPLPAARGNSQAWVGGAAESLSPALTQPSSYSCPWPGSGLSL